MRYKWDLNELRENKRMLEEIYNTFDDEDLKFYIEGIINTYSDMFYYGNSKKLPEVILNDNYINCTVDQLIDQLILASDSNSFKYIEELLNSFHIIKDSKFDISSIPTKIIATNDELVQITENFFHKMTTFKIEKQFKDILDKNRIQIDYTKGVQDYPGFTFVDGILNTRYIHITRSNTLFDSIILPHEAFHYIFCKTDTKGSFSKYNARYLSEIEGMFANILFSEYYAETATSFNPIFRNFNNSLYQQFLEELIVKRAILDSLTEKKRIRFHKLNKFLQYVCPNSDNFTNKEELVSFLETPQDITITYALSYLTALDLYYIYLKDREEAFYYLECIKNYPETNQVLQLLYNNGITFMEDDYSNLKKYIKK